MVPPMVPNTWVPQVTLGAAMCRAQAAGAAPHPHGWALNKLLYDEFTAADHLVLE